MLFCAYRSEHMYGYDIKTALQILTKYKEAHECFFPVQPPEMKHSESNRNEDLRNTHLHK